AGSLTRPNTIGADWGESPRICRSTLQRLGGKVSVSGGLLFALIEEATADAHDESEQTSCFFTMIEENLLVPFDTRMLGMQVTVESVDLTDDERIVAVCSRGGHRQRVSILDLPLPDPAPEGVEWIEAYRVWSSGSWS
ncbi:MAG: hypothetical protein QG671_4183, partial [Actinomycetota bacterium]|nr:hypothetical protein [Actinomycetota bacterium]